MDTHLWGLGRREQHKTRYFDALSGEVFGVRNASIVVRRRRRDATPAIMCKAKRERETILMGLFAACSNGETVAPAAVASAGLVQVRRK